MLFAAFSVAGVLGGVAALARWADSGHRVWRVLARNAYGVYYVHPLVLYPGALLMLGVPLPGPVKEVLLFVVAVALSLALTAGVLRRLPVVRAAF